MRYLTNLSNSTAGIIDLIRSQERQHWLRGLRQAELILLEKEGALLHAKTTKAKQERDRALATEILNLLTPVARTLNWIPILGCWLNNKIETIEDEIGLQDAAIDKEAAMVRDCLQEFEVAHRERDRIIAENPIVKELSYKEIEERFGRAALLEKKLSYIVPRDWAADRGLPESVGVVLHEATPEDREYLLTRLFSQKAELQAAEINSLPPLQRQEIIAQIKGI